LLAARQGGGTLISQLSAATGRLSRKNYEGTELFAIIKTGGKQYKVTANDTITVMALAGAPGDSVTFGDVLMLAADGEPAFGAPTLPGAEVTGEIVAQSRAPKVIAFKKRRRKNSKRKRGHRQELTKVRITGITADSSSAPALPLEE
jgi:large subunit ribosomal protein L21